MTRAEQQLMDRCEPMTVIFPDGAKAWVRAASEQNKGLKCAAVKHLHSQFVLQDRTALRRGASRWRGTQKADRDWDILDQYIPRAIHTLKEKQLNPELWLWIRSWKWRKSVSTKDLYSELGAACR